MPKERFCVLPKEEVKSRGWRMAGEKKKGKKAGAQWVRGKVHTNVGWTGKKKKRPKKGKREGVSRSNKKKKNGEAINARKIKGENLPSFCMRKRPSANKD